MLDCLLNVLYYHSERGGTETGRPPAGSLRLEVVPRQPVSGVGGQRQQATRVEHAVADAGPDLHRSPSGR